MRRLVALRKASQAAFLLFFIYILWSTTYPLRSAFPSDIFFKIDPLLMLVTSLSERNILAGTVFSLITIILTLIAGRFFCGWVCPFGTVMDTVGALKKEKRVLRDTVNRRLSLPKFLLLAVIVAFSIAGIQIAWVFDPIVIMARFVSLNLIPAVTLATNNFFIFIIQKFGLYGSVYDLYRTLKSSFLGINTYFFHSSGVIFLFFVCVTGTALFLSRFWCRSLCPLGAIYALFAKCAVLKRTAERCNACKKCRRECRMGAIRDDLSYSKGECILCMDCIYSCPQHSTRFSFASGKRTADEGEAGGVKLKGGISRRNFLFLVLGSSAYMLGFGKKQARGIGGKQGNVIRPPAALREGFFLDRCVRCGNCMKVCITNGLQPAFLESGISGIWTPRLVPEIGYCEYYCTLCGNVCPTGAIPGLTLSEKKRVRLGCSEIYHGLCLPWSKGIQCLVCEEHCPVPEKAIRLLSEETSGGTLFKPFVKKELCVGCGICQNKCPVRPERAIRVSPLNADRT